MKHMVLGVLSGGIVVLFVVVLLTMQHKNVRKEELEQSLTEAMETTLQMVPGGCRQRLYFRRYEDITDSKSGSTDEFQFRINRSDDCSRCRKRITFCGSGRVFFVSGWENGQYKVLPYNSYR